MILITMLFAQENIDYKINIWGVPAAKCNYSIIDTIFYDIPSKKIKYKAETIGLYDFFYPVKNNYTIDVISVKFIKGKKPIIKLIEWKLYLK